MESCGAVLERVAPEPVISKQKLRRAEGISLVRSKREEGSQVLAFSSRPFVMCGLPVRKPPAGQLLFERRNGAFLLQITGHPEFGLPYGQDRLVPIYLATLAVQQKSQTVRFRSGPEMLDTFGMSKGGKEYRRLIQAFERIFGATIFFGSDRLKGTAKVVQRSRFNFLQEALIWYNRDADQTALSEDFENTVVLSDDFYNEITSHPIPTEPGSGQSPRWSTCRAGSVHVVVVPMPHLETKRTDPDLRAIRPSPAIGFSGVFTPPSIPRKDRAMA
jgi:hypothetical protein